MSDRNNNKNNTTITMNMNKTKINMLNSTLIKMRIS